MKKSANLLSIFVAILSSARAITQEIVFYNNEGNYFGFVTPISDASRIPFGNITKICAKGAWILYSMKDYEDVKVGLSYGTATRCWTQNGPTINSFRYLGASETNIDSISLYADRNFEGPELYVESSAYAGIPVPILSVAITGSSNWEAYEGTNFNGTSECLVASPNKMIYRSGLNKTITNIGSVIKGCTPSLEPSTTRAPEVAAAAESGDESKDENVNKVEELGPVPNLPSQADGSLQDEATVQEETK